jgi:hypothetical protein
MNDLPPTALVTEYTVSCLPMDDEDANAFSVKVVRRGRCQWAVVKDSKCLGADGKWAYESLPSSRTDEFLATHRFDLDTAMDLAKYAALRIVVNGFTVSTWLAERRRTP